MVSDGLSFSDNAERRSHTFRLSGTEDDKERDNRTGLNRVKKRVERG